MTARTELFLYHLSWTAGRIMRPTWRNLDQSFEGWAYGNGLLRIISRLEGRALLEASGAKAGSGERVYRLTRLGQLRALGGIDPHEEWKKPWDGLWRMALFDLPETERSTRARVRRTLAALRFGCLQRSAWLTVRPLSELSAELAGVKVEAGQLTFFEGVNCGGEKPAEMVTAAWDFAGVNACWRALDAHLDVLPRTAGKPNPERILTWSSHELELWRKCVAMDPFLPKILHPKTYPGMQIWEKRLELLAKLGREVAPRCMPIPRA